MAHRTGFVQAGQKDDACVTALILWLLRRGAARELLGMSSECNWGTKVLSRARCLARAATVLIALLFNRRPYGPQWFEAMGRTRTRYDGPFGA